jgi:hypothetical protein
LLLGVARPRRRLVRLRIGRARLALRLPAAEKPAEKAARLPAGLALALLILRLASGGQLLLKRLDMLGGALQRLLLPESELRHAVARLGILLEERREVLVGFVIHRRLRCRCCRRHRSRRRAASYPLHEAADDIAFLGGHADVLFRIEAWDENWGQSPGLSIVSVSS